MGLLVTRLVLIGVTLASLIFLNTSSVVESAAASEWSLGPAEEYVTAFINVTYLEAKKLHTEKSEIGRYGAGKVGPVSGIVVHVFSKNRTDVHYGCDYPYGNNLPSEPWIALVRRGNCSFDKKLENAYRSNASGLVVYAREDKEPLEKMSFKNCNYCDIPSVFTYRYKGEEIAEKVDNGIVIYMYITVGETCSRPYSGINRTSVLFVSISFIVLMIISLAWLVFYYVQRFRYLHAKDRLAQRLCNAAKKALAKIPTRNIKLTDKEILGEGECCAVCIELYRSGDTLRTLPCKHEFHKCCVDPWLLEHRTCPMCKMDILKYYGFIQFTGSQESILHLDIEDGILNSSESRETDSPIHEAHQHQHHTHQHSAHVDEPTHSSSLSNFPSQPNTGSMRKTSLISMTVVAAPRGTFITTTSECGECRESNLKSIVSSPIEESKQSNSSSSLQNNDQLGKSRPASDESLSKTKSPYIEYEPVKEMPPGTPSASQVTQIFIPLINNGADQSNSPPAQQEKGLGPYPESPQSIKSLTNTTMTKSRKSAPGENSNKAGGESFSNMPKSKST